MKFVAEVLPFPLTRRRSFVRRQAAWLSSMDSKGAAHTLVHQLRVQRDALVRKGVEPKRADAECRDLEAAIRAQIWHMARQPGGAA